MNKRLYFIFLIIPIINTLIGCKEKHNVYKPTTTIIEGQITSPEASVISLIGLDEVKSTIDQDGKFFIQAELDKSGIYSLELANQKLNVFIIPGDRISIFSDYRNILAATFKGSHLNENNYLLQYEKIKTEAGPQDYQVFFTKNEADFLNGVEERIQIFIKDQQEFQQKNGPFDETFAEMISNEVSFDAANFKMNYPEYFNYFYPDSLLVLSDSYDSFFQNLDPDLQSNLLIPSFKEFLGHYLEFKTKQDKTNEDVPHSVQKIDKIEDLFTDEDVRNFAYYLLLKQTIDQSINEATLIINKYQTVQKNQKYLEEINGIYRVWSHLIKGKPAPEISYISNKNKSEILKTSDSKVTYIDVWATWCGPCLKELPALEKLQLEFADQASYIDFVSISIDENKMSWENMVKEKKMKGIQLFANGNWDSNLVRDYKINGIPRFVIIGKDGKIVDANAPRPSSKEIASLLKSAIAE